MKNKQIKKLAQASYTKDVLDEKKVNTIVKLLKRKHLKIYLKYLKSLEKNQKIVVLAAGFPNKTDLVKEINKIYPYKKIELKEDKNLIAGIKVIDSDNIYNFNLKNTLDNLVNYINQ